MKQRWTTDETTKLEELCGDRPWPLLVHAYNEWARYHGYRKRSSLALERRAQMLGLERKSEGNYITTGVMAEILGIDRATTLRWVRRGVIRAWRNGDRRPFPYYVSRDELRRVARANPEFFRPFAHERLVMLFDAPRVADYVYEQCPVNRVASGRKRPVICVETGRRYDSIKAAAKAAFVTTTRMWAVLDTHEVANGLHWRRAAAPNLTKSRSHLA